MMAYSIHALGVRTHLRMATSIEEESGGAKVPSFTAVTLACTHAETKFVVLGRSKAQQRRIPLPHDSACIARFFSLERRAVSRT